jgi:hypothetical protein
MGSAAASAGRLVSGLFQSVSEDRLEVCRLIIAVNLLQQGASVEIDECMVGPIW